MALFGEGVREVAISKVRPSPRNARTHPKKQIHQIAASIARFGWTYPILVDENFDVLAGHGRLLAAKSLGLKCVPVLVKVGLSDLEKRALMLADNKIAQNAGWDGRILTTEFAELAIELPQIDLELSITGFEPAEVDNLLSNRFDPESDPEDELPDLTTAGETVSRRGDIWKLGKHRLICGDARNEDVVKALFGGEVASAVFADPPYNVRIAKTVGRGRAKYREFAHASGEMSPDEFETFLRSFLDVCVQHSKSGAIFYVCMDWRHIATLQAAAAKLEHKNTIVWVKSNAGQGSFYRSQHEFIAVFKSGAGPHQNNVELGKFGRNRSNVWIYSGANSFRAGRMDDLAAHPTVKPTALVADAIRDCSSRGDIIFDPFVGSGTTILAAEQVGRRAFAVEIDARYVDVAIKRWQAFTKQDAYLEGTDQTFDELSIDTE